MAIAADLALDLACADYWNGESIVVERACERCGVVFSVKPYRIQRGEARFCSTACKHATRRQALADTLQDRFWSRVDRESGGCWLWLGPTNHGGYVQVHLCDTRRCCRPSHLVLGSAAANMADMALKGRSLRGERNPSRLHPERLARGERHGWRIHPESILAGERNPAAKLTAVQVREIRARYAAGGITQRQLAGEYGVAQSQVWSAIRGKRWTHVA